MIYNIRIGAISTICPVRFDQLPITGLKIESRVAGQDE
jgi:hypothetical protein